MSKINSIIGTYLSFKGKRKIAALFFLGVLATAALPPFFIFPALFISFPFFYLSIINSRSKKDAFWTGWWFGFGHFVTGLYWISNSLLVDPLRFAWMIPFAISLIPAVLSIYIGLVSLLTYRVRNRFLGIIAFCILWIVFEYIRSLLFSGFPWNLIGYSWAFSLPMIQAAWLSGIYGLSFLAVLVAIIPAVFFIHGSRFAKSCAVVLVITVLSGLFFWGNNRIPPLKDEGGIPIRIVQPNIPQDMKWNEDAEFSNFMKQIKISSTKDEGFKPKLIIWPEASIYFFLDNKPERREIMTEVIPDGSFLVFGGLRADVFGYGQYNIYNSVMAMNHKGEIVATYDKVKLVPFGEFVPLRSIFPFINKITPGSDDFTSGINTQPFSLDGVAPFNPLICYEIIFPGHVARTSKGAEWILNVTNDAWFGISTGPYQHFTMARLRAVEQGMPVVRVANTGISAVIDSYGRVISELELGKEGFLDVTIPLKKDE